MYFRSLLKEILEVCIIIDEFFECFLVIASKPWYHCVNFCFCSSLFLYFLYIEGVYSRKRHSKYLGSISHSLFPDREDISRSEEDYESVWNRNQYLLNPPHRFISSPDNIAHSHRYDKSEPEHKGVLYSAILRNCTDNARKWSNHQKCHNYLGQELFPHSLHHLFLLFFAWWICSPVDFHPEFPKKWSVPKCSSKKREKSDHGNSNEIDVHKKVFRNKTLPLYQITRKRNIYQRY